MAIPLRLLFCAALSLAAGSGTVPAQAPAASEAAANPTAAYNQILSALNRGDHARGLEVADAVIAYWGRRGAEEFGPGFGHFHYLRGLLLMAGEDFGRAAEAFRACHEDFPNELINLEAERERPKLANRFRAHALAQWGACLMILGDYLEAVSKLERCLAEAGGTTVRADIVGLNLGRSLLRAGEADRGRELLGKALASASLSRDLKRRAFMILAEDWSPQVSLEEALGLIRDHGQLARDDSRLGRWQRNPVFAHLARQALQSQDPLRALAWYALLLPPGEAAAHWEAELAALDGAVSGGAAPPEAAARRAELEAKRDQARAMTAAMLLGVGSAHFQLGNPASAYAAFRHVALAFPGHAQRPDALHNVVASAARLSLWGEARNFGRIFLDEFPDHPLVPEVARVVTESIFLMEEWEEALMAALEIRERFEPKSLARDVPDFVAAASLYHLDRHEEADAEMTDYRKNYPGGARAEPAAFYHGAIKVKRFLWAEAVALLDAFAESWPRSDLVPGALYQAGLCRLALDDLDEGLALMDRLQEEHPDAREIPASWNLRGDLLAAAGMGSAEEAAAAYLAAKELAARDPGGRETAAYALWKLAVLRSAEADHEQVLACHDEFRREHPASVYLPDILAASLASLVEAGREEEAESTLVELILAHAGEAAAPELSDLFGTYLAFLEMTRSPEEAIAAARSFPLPDPAPGPLRAWLTVAEIEHLEGASPPADPAVLSDLHAVLREEIAFEDCPAYPLVKLARWHLGFGEIAPARRIYERLLEERPGSAHEELALHDLGGILAASADSADHERAVECYRRLREEHEIPELQQAAVLGAARVLMRDEGRHREAARWWRDYLSQSDWLEARAEANHGFARCLELAGRPREALKVHVSVYANYPGQLDWSTASYLRAADILRAEDRPGDALLVLVDMLKRLGHLDHPGIREGRERFAAWKAEWVAAN